MNLSPHFRLAEFTRSEVAERNDIDMTAPEHVVENLKRLATEVLEPIREAVGKPLIITSGYRPLGLNAMIGGAPNSDHIHGRAADFHALGMEQAELVPLVMQACERLPVSKCIDEFGRWVHVSVATTDLMPLRSFLVAYRKDGDTRYREWV